MRAAHQPVIVAAIASSLLAGCDQKSEEHSGVAPVRNSTQSNPPPAAGDMLVQRTLAEWAAASDEDRWSAAVTMAARDTDSSMSAAALKACIDEVASSESAGSQPVAAIAASCIVIDNASR